MTLFHNNQSSLFTVVNCYVNSTCLVLRSISITETSSLLQLSLPPISQPHPCCLFPLSILQNDIEFTCSLNQPECLSCQLNPGCHVFSNQVSNTLCNGYKRNYPFLTTPFALTRLRHWFTCVQLNCIRTYRNSYSRFSLSLTTPQFPDNAA